MDDDKYSRKIEKYAMSNEKTRVPLAAKLVCAAKCKWIQKLVCHQSNALDEKSARNGIIESAAGAQLLLSIWVNWRSTTVQCVPRHWRAPCLYVDFRFGFNWRSSLFRAFKLRWAICHFWAIESVSKEDIYWIVSNGPKLNNTPDGSHKKHTALISRHHLEASLYHLSPHPHGQRWQTHDARRLRILADESRRGSIEFHWAKQPIITLWSRFMNLLAIPFCCQQFFNRRNIVCNSIASSVCAIRVCVEQKQRLTVENGCKTEGKNDWSESISHIQILCSVFFMSFKLAAGFRWQSRLRKIAILFPDSNLSETALQSYQIIGIAGEMLVSLINSSNWCIGSVKHSRTPQAFTAEFVSFIFSTSWSH